MPLTLDEIMQHEGRLRQEIVERECLLAAFKVLHTYAAEGQSPNAFELGSLASAFLPTACQPPGLEQAAISAPVPSALPSPPPVKPYIHPELEAIGSRFGAHGRIVQWAIQRMTEDYSVRELAALLQSEGYGLPTTVISVVLSRFKSRGEIEEIKRGTGRTPAVFRKPAIASPQEAESSDQIPERQSTILPGAFSTAN